MVSSLATADALVKLLIEKGLITQAEFMQKLVSGDVAEDEIGVLQTPHPQLLEKGGLR